MIFLSFVKSFENFKLINLFSNDSYGMSSNFLFNSIDNSSKRAVIFFGSSVLESSLEYLEYKLSNPDALEDVIAVKIK